MRFTKLLLHFGELNQQNLPILTPYTLPNPREYLSTNFHLKLRKLLLYCLKQEVLKECTPKA